MSLDTVSTLAPAAIEIYVAGENIPQEDTPKQARTESRSIMVAPDMGDEDIAAWWDQPMTAILGEFEQWFRRRVARGTPSELTIKAYLGDLKEHLIWLNEHGETPYTVSLSRQGEEVLVGYRHHLITKSVKRSSAAAAVRPATTMPTTVGRKLASLRRAYGIAYRKQFLRLNPFDLFDEELKAPKDKRQAKDKLKAISLDEYERLINAPDAKTPAGMRDLAILVMMSHLGLRVAEVRDLNLDNLNPGDGEHGSLKVIGKGDKERIVYLTPMIRPILDTWLNVRNMMHLSEQAMFITFKDNSCTPENGREKNHRIGTRGIRDMVDGYLSEVGAKRPGVSCHSLRHFYGTETLSSGAELKYVSLSMGHADQKTTGIYDERRLSIQNNPAAFIDKHLAERLRNRPV
jgi:integrase/recombinase XerD